MGLPRSLLIATQLIIILFTYSHPQLAVSKVHNNFTDLQSLLSFKASVADPYRILANNWTTNTSFCNWIGIFCSPRHQRVIAIKLDNFSLEGTITPYLANLSFLSVLYLTNNTFTGTIPEDIGRLPRITEIKLDNNYLSGPIPRSIFNMSSLAKIFLSSNNLSGSLPSNDDHFMLPRLKVISFSRNELTGHIPSSFARCSNLQELSLSHNKFSGNIPAKLGNLTKLNLLYLGRNQLTGMIPTTIGNLSNLNELDLPFNHLEGIIPTNLGNLQNLEYLALTSNKLNGSIPIALLNASMLSSLILTQNKLSGHIPATFGASLPLLTYLDMSQNQLTGGLDFITSLSNCKDLNALGAERNELDGILPDSLGNLSTNLNYFSMGKNHIKGSIPTVFGNISSLLLLELEENELTGEIPSALTKLKNLQVLDMGENKLHGFIPSDIGLMTSVNILYLPENALSGSVPESLGNISGLAQLALDHNELVSNIPSSLRRLSGLIELSLSRNNLDGSLPTELGYLRSLNRLDISNNQLSGGVSRALGELQMLTYLDLSHNSLSSQIPNSLGSLINVEYLNLSYNLLSGVIPKSLATLRYLSSLDLSFNKLEGQIPRGRVFSNISIPSLIGNAALCGAPQLGFSNCSSNHVLSNSKRKAYPLKYVLPPIASAVVLLTCFYLLLIFRRRDDEENDPPYEVTFSNDLRVTSSNDLGEISYDQLVAATDNFSDANLLGKGSVSSVFKACLADESPVAVKVLNLEVQGASRSFDAEFHALMTVRHRNLVKIIGTCSNLDSKILVLQFMSNGTLEKWLHSHDANLNILQRVNIMVDVSFALEYLHHHNARVIVHCDLKPSNVLLDENLVAHVGDFGLAKLLLHDSTSASSASAPGTIGYIPPEYGSTGKVSTKGDVYSFGILLLETFTRKRPTDAMFNGELSLRRWVHEAYPNAIMEIVDHNLLKEDFKPEEEPGLAEAAYRCLSSVIELGLMCSWDSPKERVSMRDVVPMLQKIKTAYLSKMGGT